MHAPCTLMPRRAAHHGPTSSCRRQHTARASLATCRASVNPAAPLSPAPLPQGAAHAQQPQQFPEFKVLYRDEHLIAIDKPRGFFVHPPEDGRLIPLEENGLWLLKRQLQGQWLWPVHRLDRATSGVVLYCLSREAAAAFGQRMRDRAVRKTYHAFVRGYTPTWGQINEDIGGAKSLTLYETLGRCILPLKVGKWSTARYSLLRLEPRTGRFHQLRRHLNYISHPIVGDGDHGDRYHNRAFLNDLGIPGMFLRASTLELTHPITGQPLCVSVDSWEDRWHTAFNMVGVCPPLPPNRHPTNPAQRRLDRGVLQQQIQLSQQSLETVFQLRQQHPDQVVHLPDRPPQHQAPQELAATQPVTGVAEISDSELSDAECDEDPVTKIKAAWRMPLWEPLPVRAAVPTPPAAVAVPPTIL